MNYTQLLYKYKPQTKYYKPKINMSIIKAVNLDLNKVSFSDVKTDNHGRKMVYVNYNGGKIIVQTPKMYVPNGIKRWRKKDAIDNKDDSFEMELSFGGEDKDDKNSQEIKMYHDKMEEFDTMIKETIIKNSSKWLGKAKMNMDLVESAFYAPTVKVAVDKDGNTLDYPSRVKSKIDREREGDSDNFTGRFLSNKKFKTPLYTYDESKVQTELNEQNFENVVPKGSQVVAVLELVYLSITTKVSSKWKLVQARVSKNQQAITGYAMLDDDDEEVEDLDSETPQTQEQEQHQEQTQEQTQELIQEELEEEDTLDLDDLSLEEPVVQVKKTKSKK